MNESELRGTGDHDPDSIDVAWIGTEVGGALAHGNALVEELFAEIRDWNRANPVTMRASVDPGATSVTFVVEPFDEPPLWRWGQKVGDALHNWRRMLDTLALELSNRYRERQLNSSQRGSIKFPLYDSPAEFDAACASSRHWLSALDEEHQERLRYTQPFNTGNPQDSALRWLQVLDNRRKHQGGFSLRRVLDHAEGFLFMALEDAEGEDMGVPESAIHRLSWEKTLVVQLPVVHVGAPGVHSARATEPVPTALRIIRDQHHEADMENMVLALSEQLVATVTLVYTGVRLPWTGQHEVDS